MTDSRAERNEPTRARGHRTGPWLEQTIGFTPELWQQIHNEATARGWTFSHMVRHLCEASIEGIE